MIYSTTGSTAKPSHCAQRSQFPHARHVYLEDIADLAQATHFELRPICDGIQYACTSYLYGHDTNRVQLRMGRHGKPAELIAIYNKSDMAKACDAFFRLSTYDQPLWYDGNDILARVSSKADLVRQIAPHAINIGGDDALAELFANTGLDDAERMAIIEHLEQ